MGGILGYKGNPKHVWLPMHGICMGHSVEIGTGKILCYHKSWDWLIPVIDKVYSLKEYYVYCDKTSSQFNEGGIYINTRNISVTYEQVVGFIQWYNENQK